MKKNWLRLLCLLIIGTMLVTGALADSIVIGDESLDQAAVQIETDDEGLVLEELDDEDVPELDGDIAIELDDAPGP